MKRKLKNLVHEISELFKPMPININTIISVPLVIKIYSEKDFNKDYPNYSWVVSIYSKDEFIDNKLYKYILENIEILELTCDGRNIEFEPVDKITRNNKDIKSKILLIENKKDYDYGMDVMLYYSIPNYIDNHFIQYNYKN